VARPPQWRILDRMARLRDLAMNAREQVRILDMFGAQYLQQRL
jgi:hypothetical protein